MSIIIVIQIFIVLAVYIIPCYYIGIKGRKIILPTNSNIRPKSKVYYLVYWLIYWSIALSYIISNILRGVFNKDNWLTSITTLIGVGYLGILFYSVLLFLVIDTLKLIFKKVNLSTVIKKKINKIYLNGISIFLIVFIIVTFGFFNAQNKIITNYEVNIDKKASEITSLNIVMISDVHMGIALKEDGINQMINSINELNPDIVLFCGDLFDGNTPLDVKEHCRKAFKNIKSKYGAYDITGNHDYGAGDLSETISYLEDGKVKVLQDEVVKIADSFYVVGRNDPAGESLTGKVKPLSDILEGVDKSIPIIVLNHRPQNLDEAESEGVDLQLSGHTHNGQVFPGKLITKHIYEKDYGYLNKGNFNLIVSSGYGTWGPPIRVGTRSEIVNIKVNFKQ